MVGDDALGHVQSEMRILLDSFPRYFSERQYTEVPPVDISSRIDKSVHLIGSHISVLKPYIESGEVPLDGLHMVQPCIRTHSLPHLTNDDKQPKWGTFFRSLGALIHPSRAEKLLWDASDYLLGVVGIPKDSLVLRVSSEDGDLLSYAMQQQGTGIRIERDQMPIAYYRHKLGMEEVSGRNFNYSVMRNGEFSDLGNFIIIEKRGRPVAIELGLGSSSIVKEKLGLSHVCLAEPLNLTCRSASNVRPKLYDAIIAATHLLSEGVRPSSKRYCSRTLRSLLQGIVYLANVAGHSAEEIVAAVHDYEARYALNTLASSTMAEYLNMYR